MAKKSNRRKQPEPSKGDTATPRKKEKQKQRKQQNTNPNDKESVKTAPSLSTTQTRPSTRSASAHSKSTEQQSTTQVSTQLDDPQNSFSVLDESSGSDDLKQAEATLPGTKTARRPRTQEEIQRAREIFDSPETAELRELHQLARLNKSFSSIEMEDNCPNESSNSEEDEEYEDDELQATKEPAKPKASKKAQASAPTTKSHKKGSTITPRVLATDLTIELESNTDTPSSITNQEDSKTSEKTTQNETVTTKTQSKKKATKKPPPPTSTTTTTVSQANPFKDLRFRGFLKIDPIEAQAGASLHMTKAIRGLLSGIKKVMHKQCYLRRWDDGKLVNVIGDTIKNDTEIVDVFDHSTEYGIFFNTKHSQGLIVRDNLTKQLFIPLGIRICIDKPSLLGRHTLESLGPALSKFFGRKKPIQIQANPIPCQCARPETIGWLVYSDKTIDGKAMRNSIYEQLKIPRHVAIGVYWSEVTQNHEGKRTPYSDTDEWRNRLQAMHIDMDIDYFPRYEHYFDMINPNSSKKPLRLHQMNLRLCPAYGTPSTVMVTEEKRRLISTLAAHQAYMQKPGFLSIMKSTQIANLDTLASDMEDLTLRKLIMAMAPEGEPTKRLFLNVDKSWGDPTSTSFLVSRPMAARARIAINSIIPYALFYYPECANSWFIPTAVQNMQKIKWNPLKNAIHSKADEVLLKHMMDNDPLKDMLSDEDYKKFQEDQQPKEQSNATSEKTPKDTPAATIKTTAPKLSDLSVKAFENLRTNPDSTPIEETNPEAYGKTPANAEARKDSTLKFDMKAITEGREKTTKLRCDPNEDNFSTSTAARTTDSVRSNFRRAKIEISEKDELIEKLQRQVARLSKDPGDTELSDLEDDISATIPAEKAPNTSKDSDDDELVKDDDEEAIEINDDDPEEIASDMEADEAKIISQDPEAMEIDSTTEDSQALPTSAPEPKDPPGPSILKKKSDWKSTIEATIKPANQATGPTGSSETGGSRQDP